jgi:SAM-dependent methyltransferase
VRHAREVSLANDTAPLHGLLRRVEEYYTRKILLHGPTAAGVDWSSAAAQQVRFRELLKVCDLSGQVSLNDLGCGYGALLVYLFQHHSAVAVDYLGVDVSPAMIWHARRSPHCHDPGLFVEGHGVPRVADYTVASGVFNVRLGQPTILWRRFVQHSLRQMSAGSRKGFAVNFVDKADAAQAGRHGLYVCSPALWRDWCERALQVSVEVVSGYGLPEFTLLARRTGQGSAN